MSRRSSHSTSSTRSARNASCRGNNNGRFRSDINYSRQRQRNIDPMNSNSARTRFGFKRCRSVSIYRFLIVSAALCEVALRSVVLFVFDHKFEIVLVRFHVFDDKILYIGCQTIRRTYPFEGSTGNALCLHLKFFELITRESRV